MSGVTGAYSLLNPNVVVDYTFKPLSFIQHRGEIGAGITVGKNGGFSPPHKELGNRVYIIFQRCLDQLKMIEPNVAVAHTKFGKKDQLQPNTYDTGGRYKTAFAKDGNVIGMSSYETGAFLHDCLEETQDIYHAAEKFMKELYGRGAYSIVWSIVDKKNGDMKLVGIRDPFGINPFCKGEKDGAYLLCSETIGIRSVGARCSGFVEPGGVVVFYEDKELPTEVVVEAPRHYHDFFEYLYTASPFSELDGAGRSNFEIRYDIGRDLAYKFPVDADIYAGSPDSGIPVSLGYIRGINEQILESLQKDGKRVTMDDLKEFLMPIGKNRGAVRTFFADPSVRDMESELKFVFNESIITPGLRIINPDEVCFNEVAGRKVVVIDDSLVKGTVYDSTISKIEYCGGVFSGLVLSSPALVANSIRDFDDTKQRLLHGHWDKTNEEKMRIASEKLGYPVYYSEIPDVVRQIGIEDLDLGTVSGWFPLKKEYLPDGYRSLL